MSLPAPALRTEAVTARKEARLKLRRMRLLGAALDLFAERGYEETSVGAIVARARMSKSALYEHVKTKEHWCREGGVAAVHAAVSYFPPPPGVDADSLAASLCRIFAP